MLERYNDMLSAIQQLCSTAHIAGGAVRDSLLERPIKDIDLFLQRLRDCRGGQAAASGIPIRHGRRVGRLR